MIALGAVGLIHVLLGYALITGLASKFVKQIAEPLKTVNIKDTPPPPDEPPPPPPKDIEIPPFVPPPEVTIENQAPPPPVIQSQSVVAPPPQPAYVPPRVETIAPPTPPAPPAGVTSAAVPSRGNTGAITDDDFPEASKRAEEKGSTRVSYTVSTEGKATQCTVTQSSGFPRLDEQTCRLIERRYKFKPALRDGKPVTETKTQTITWKIKDGA